MSEPGLHETVIPPTATHIGRFSAEWDGALLLEQMRAAAWWFTGDQPLRLAPEDVWRGSEPLRDGSGDQMIEQMRRMTLPPEALLLRRMEGLLFQIAATLRAEAPWGPLLRELIESGPLVGEFGREQAEWLGSRSQRSRR